MKKRYLPILLFGMLLASLALVMQFFEYKYLIGSLNTDIYTSIVATVFTILGVWIGITWLKKKSPNESHISPSMAINKDQIEALKLNDREFQVLQLIAKGHTNQEIADQLYLALPTIKTHVSNLYAKLDVRNRTQAVRKAQELKLIEI